MGVDGTTREQGGADRSAFHSALGTEYFALQGIRSSTVSEAMGRATLFFTTLTGTLLALGLLAGTSYGVAPVAYAAAPIVAMVGLLSFLRLVQLGVEDLVALQAIQRIRAYYATLAPEAPAFFPPPGAHQEINVLIDTGGRRGPWKAPLTVAATVGVVEVLFIGASVAFAGVDLGAPVAASVLTGAAVALAVALFFLRHQTRCFTAVVGEGPSLSGR